MADVNEKVVEHKVSSRKGTKKDGRFINVKLRADLYVKLCDFCEKSGQSKTVAVERAIEEYCVPRLAEYEQNEAVSVANQLLCQLIVSVRERCVNCTAIHIFFVYVRSDVYDRSKCCNG